MSFARSIIGVAYAIAAIVLAAPPASSGDAIPGATVDDLLARVRKFNPEVAAAALDREAAVARIAAAGALDDPMLSLSRDQGFRQTLLSVSQDFPLWGKRDLRRGVAEANAAAVAGRAGSAVAELEEAAKVAFSQYYQAEAAIRATGEIRSLLKLLAESVRARYAQGLADQADAIRAELERTRIDPELSALKRDREVAKARINALIGRSADAELARPRLLRRLPAAASLDLRGLMMRASTTNPALAASRAEIGAAEGERRLVDKSWYPDVTLSLGTDHLPNMGPRITAGVGIKVPLQWGVREAQAREATAKRGAAELRLEAAKLKVESELQVALASLRRAQLTENLLTHGLAQQSEAAFRSALASYQQGRGDLTSVLDAARRRLEIRVETLRVETEAQTAFAAIERLAGGGL